MVNIALLETETQIVHIFKVKTTPRSMERVQEGVSKWCDKNGVQESSCQWMEFKGIVKFHV